MGMQGIIPPNINYNKNISDGYQIRPYTAGETCIHNNTLYKAKQDITVAENWNPEHWKETTVEQELSAVNTKIANITPDDTAVDGKPWTSKHIVDMLCPPLKVSGNPVQCYPVEGYPLGITASWEPMQEGTGDPSPENIRPIKGRDSVTVTRCGENIYSGDGLDNVTWATEYPNMVDALNTLPSGVYYINFDFSLDEFSKRYTSDTAEANALRISIMGNGNKYLSYTAGKTITKKTKLPLIEKVSLKLDITEDTVGKIEHVYCYACGRDSAVEGAPNGPLGVGSIYNASITASQPAEYTPYTGDTTTLTLPETIYGGSVDAVSGDGESQYNKVNIRMENLDYNARIQAMLGYASQNILNDIQLPSSDSIAFDGVCDYFQTKPAAEINSGAIGLGVSVSGDIYLKAEGLSSKEAYVAKFPDGMNVCYKVATPASFSATGNAPAKALSGINTVLTDADSVEVTGREDLPHAITGQ